MSKLKRFFGLESKEDALPKAVKKSLVVPSSSYGTYKSGYSFYDCLNNGGGTYSNDLAIIHTLNLYASVSPFYIAVDKIAKAISEIPFKVKDSKSGEFIEHEVLDLLNNPNVGMTGGEFKYEISTFFSVSGNAFLNSTGRVTAPPLEIWSIQPQRVIPQFSSTAQLGQLPSRYQVNSVQQVSSFFDAEEVNEDNGVSTVRYYNDTNGELWQIRQFNPFYNANNFYGMSKARPLILELEQFVSGNSNNLSLLKRGARPSVAWVNNRGEQLTEDQYDRIQEEAKKYSGDQNAGGTPILDGMDIKEMSQNNRDMQFKELQEGVKEAIYNAYGIPLASMTSDAMTYDNLTTAQLQFYDNAVIPQMNYITSELTRFLMYRYPDGDNLEITYCPNEIEALKPRSLDNTTKLSALNISTVNELRADIGEQPLDEGGENVMGESTQVVIISEDGETNGSTGNQQSQEDDMNADSEDSQSDEEDSQDGDSEDSQNDEENDQDDEEAAKKLFIESMRAHKFSDAKIDKMWKRVKWL